MASWRWPALLRTSVDVSIHAPHVPSEVARRLAWISGTRAGSLMSWQLPRRIYSGRVDGLRFRLFPDGFLWGVGILDGRAREDGAGSLLTILVRPRLRVRGAVWFSLAIALAVTALAVLRPPWYQAESVGQQLTFAWGFWALVYALAVALVRGDAGAARRDLVRLCDAEGGTAVGQSTAKPA